MVSPGFKLFKSSTSANNSLSDSRISTGMPACAIAPRAEVRTTTERSEGMVSMFSSEAEACHWPFTFSIATRLRSPLSSSLKNWISVASPLESKRTLTVWPARNCLSLVSMGLLASTCLMLFCGTFRRVSTSVSVSPGCTASSVQ